AMDHIGIDVHKRESQICILAEGGELIEQRIRTEPDRFAAVLGGRPRARILIEASTDSEWVARCLEGLGHEGHRRGSELRPDVRDPDAEGQDGPAGRAHPGRRQSARGLPPGPSALRRPAPCARPPGGPRGPCPYPLVLHLAHPRCASPAWIPRPLRT